MGGELGRAGWGRGRDIVGNTPALLHNEGFFSEEDTADRLRTVSCLNSRGVCDEAPLGQSRGEAGSARQHRQRSQASQQWSAVHTVPDRWMVLVQGLHYASHCSHLNLLGQCLRALRSFSADKTCLPEHLARDMKNNDMAHGWLSALHVSEALVPSARTNRPVLYSSFSAVCPCPGLGWLTTSSAT
ncbi:hypothetical protein BDW62DRAFT_136444 [Aspergillus aurantiobrunneus]